MKVSNIHKREIAKPKAEVLALFATLGQRGDKIWPHEKWPAMKFKEGLQIGAEGGHGPIRYKVIDYSPSGNVTFQFQRPNGFNGTHKFEVTALDAHRTEIKHTIAMKTSGTGTLSWPFAVRWLHDALIEDAFDKVENLLCDAQRKTEWSWWVRGVRRIMAP